MADTAPARTKHRQQDEILEAVAFAAERFLRASDWLEAAQDVLARLGAAAGAGRAYVVRADRDERGAVQGSTWEAEWCAPGIAPLLHDSITASAPWFPRWRDLLAAGQAVQGDVEEFPDDERRVLSSHGVVSVLALPVLVHDRWWGSIGLDDERPGRGWHGPALDALRTAAQLLSAAIERQQHDERLRDAEERYRKLVERIPAVTYTDVPDDGVVRMGFVSPQIQDVLGYPPEAFVDDPGLWKRLIHPDDRAHLEAIDAFDINDTAPFDHEYRMLAADGREVWVHDTSLPMFGEDGRIEYFQGFMLDITERMKTAEQIRLAEERYRSLVEHTPAITYQETTTTDPYDPTSSIAYVSPQIESILGYTPEQWSQPGFWATVVHPEDLPAVIEVGARTVADAEPYRQDYRMIASDGRVVWFHDEAHPIVGDGGHVVWWQGVMTDVTERKEAEDRLRRTQARLQALMENVPAVVYTQAIDGEPGEFWISPQSQAIFGYAPEGWSATDHFWEERLHPDDRERVLALDAATDATLAPFSHEYRFRRADGSYAWVLDEAVFVPNVTEDGRGLWQGLLFDVTERKEAEQRRVEAERVFRATVEHLPAIVYRESPDQDPARFYLSPQVEAVTGWTVDEWTGTRGFWRDHLHPEDRVSVLEANAHADRTRERFAVDYRFRHEDGTWVWLHDEATFVEGVGEGFWQGFMFDVTERKQVEQHLREAEEKFRTIVEQNQAIFYIQEIDPQDPAVSLTTYIAPGNTDLIGYTEEEIKEDPGLWRSTVHPDDRERVFAADAESNIAGGDRFSMEYRMIHKDGRIVWVQDEARLVRIGDAPPYWQGFLLDITERKQAEEQLAHALEVEREATGRLRRLDEMKNTFLQAVSHDLRTPLAAILGLAITLERSDVDLDEQEARQLAGRIAGNARRLDRLVTNLLDLDRLARGIVAPRLRATDIGALVRSVIDGSGLIPHDRLRTNIGSVTIPADGAKVERIVENLLANTARHTPEHATIWVTVGPQDDGALIAIEDDGPGVAADLRDTIFEPFQQGPDAPQHSPGVGVGLTLVRRFAELHGGRAWVGDRRGGGASFRVFLPRRPPAATGPEEDR
jgi:PAS domain S-box-containing protein